MLTAYPSGVADTPGRGRGRCTGSTEERDAGDAVHVTQGDKIPPCPGGKNEFDTRTGEPGNKG